ncbi:MAG TPA: right-handed parallel beta-helix repeat-containing protein, partial [Saprospiraceae bacterium]|nr:right-handed parallel beta-helix repeat-containing protein [Saprospiraceae bacterium]
MNSTVSGNTTANDSFDSGGGIGVALSFTNIINSTITDNGSNGGASGVRVEGGTMTVRNSIIAGNRNNAAVPDVTKASSTTVTSLGNNIIGNAPDAGFTNGVNNDQVGNSTSPLNPLLGSLANNGGPTPTHALLPTSPAIGNGNNCVLDLTCMTNNPPFALTTDQRGSPRSTPVDIGAYENFPCPSFNTLYVDQSTSSSGDGTSWATAFKTLDEALLIAHNCPGVTTINVAAGTYKPGTKPYENGAPITTPDARDVTFHLANGVALYGGFPNGGGLRDIAANPTILSGDFNDDDVISGSGSTLSITGNGENAYHVVLSVNDTATTVLDGFTISGGNANGLSTITVEGQTIFRNQGGGMFNSNSSPTITNTTFTGNSANQGGGMYNSNSSPTITNTTFTGNSANQGGGMYNSNSSPTITNTTFTGNSANQGGGMYNSNSSPTITNTTFTGNSA